MLSKSTIDLHLQRMIELFHILEHNIICNHFLPFCYFLPLNIYHALPKIWKVCSWTLSPNHTTMQSNHGTKQEHSKAITVKSSTRAKRVHTYTTTIQDTAGNICHTLPLYFFRAKGDPFLCRQRPYLFLCIHAEFPRGISTFFLYLSGIVELRTDYFFSLR